MSRPKKYGVEKHGAGYRIKMRWTGVPGFYVESGFADEIDAELRGRDLYKLRATGAPAPSAGAALTVGAALDAWRLDREGAHDGHEGEVVRDSTLTRDDATIKALLLYFDRDLPLTKLTRPIVVAAHRDRAKAHPKSASEELALLKRALRHAEDHGAAGIDAGIQTIKRSPVPRRQRRALTSREFEAIARHAKVDGRIGRGLLPCCELPELLAFSGLRIREALALRDADVEVEPSGAMWLRIRSNKEGNPDKRVRVVHKALRARLRKALTLRDATAGPRPLFADEYGKPLTYSQAYGSVLTPARRAAEAEWTREHPGHDPLDNPYRDGELTPHDLRSTFATVMRVEYELSRPTVARLLGHRDGGKLLDRVYDKSDRDAMVDREIDALEAAEVVEAPAISCCDSAIATGGAYHAPTCAAGSTAAAR